ncbi:MAG: undecaprenyl-diphosphate phosphatase [Candidatus Aenigmatarchaeota archaeon]
MEASQAFVLAVVQGLTEWFPVSSSAHLVAFQRFLGMKASVAFDVMLHLGTLFAVIYFLRKDLIELMKFKRNNEKMFAYIIIGSLPIAFFGFLFKNFFEFFFSSSIAVGIALIINGLILYSTKFFQSKRKMNFFDSFLIGIAQVFSLFPGISRSGITISTALVRGINKTTAYKFSFFISILPIIGAALMKSGEIDFSQESLETFLIGISVSGLVGYVALKTIARIVLKGSFYKFAYYCWIFGIIVLALSFNMT